MRENSQLLSMLKEVMKRLDECVGFKFSNSLKYDSYMA